MNTQYTDKSSRITSDVVKRANEKLIREVGESLNYANT